MRSGISRFTYWNFLDVNPLLRQQFEEKKIGAEEFHRMFDPQLSQSYQDSFQSGDKNAIFAYAEINPFFLQQPWVRNELQIRALSPSKASRTWVDRLMFGNRRGLRNETNPEQLQKIIERDKLIFIGILRLRQSGHRLTGSYSPRGGRPETISKSVFHKLSMEHSVSEESIRDVYRHYRKFYAKTRSFVETELDIAIRKMINHKYGKLPLKGYSRTPTSIPHGYMARQTREIRKIKSQLYTECKQQLDAFKNNEVVKDHIFATSLILNDFSTWWKGAVGHYFPRGFSEEKFVDFVQDCRVMVKDNRFFLPYHFAVQSIIEAIYRRNPNASVGDFLAELGDLKPKHWLRDMGLLDLTEQVLGSRMW